MTQSPSQPPTPDKQPVEHLVAAHPVADALQHGRPAYMPRVPWKTLLGLLAFVLISVFGFRYRERLKTQTLRSEIVSAYSGHVAPLATRYRTFRSKLETLVFASAVASAGPDGAARKVDPRLRVSGLHASEGVYLRIPREHANAQHIEGAALQMGPDAILGCLGIAPMSLRGLYDAGAFLMPTWLANVSQEQDLMKLRVSDYELSHRSQVDVPVVQTMMDARYFLLILESGGHRDPVDVFLFDIPTQTELLRAHIVPEGVLLPVRLRFEGVHTTASRVPSNALAPSAFDCSVAAQIKALTGEPALSVGSDIAALTDTPVTMASDAQTASDAGTNDAR